MLPAVGHEPKFTGRLGKELNADQGREATRIALNVLSAARNHLGSLDKVTKVVRLGEASSLQHQTTRTYRISDW